MSAPILCPECGWTGEESDLNGDRQCPVCAEVIEFVE